MSNGNAEQPTAQAPRGHSSPNRVEVSGEGRQGAAASNAQGQESSNGQSKEHREEQLAKAPTSAATARAGAAGGTTSPQSPGTAARPQPTSGARPGGSPGTPPVDQKQQPAQQTPQKQAPQPSTQQKQGPSPTNKPQQVQSPPAQRPPQPQTGGQTGSASARKQPRQSPSSPGAPDARSASGAVPVWDPPPPAAPKEGLWTRLGFGRKAERPEGNAAAPPAQQPRVPPTQPAPATPRWGAISGRSDRSGRAAHWSAGAAAPDARGSAWGPSWRSAWDPSWTSARGFRRSRRCSGCGSGGRGVHPGSSAGACRAAWHTPPGTRPPKRADRPYARSPRRSTCFPSRPSLRTASARAHRTGRSSHADAGAAHAACCSDCNPGTGPGERHSKEPARRCRSGRRGA